LGFLPENSLNIRIQRGGEKKKGGATDPAKQTNRYVSSREKRPRERKREPNFLVFIARNKSAEASKKGDEGGNEPVREGKPF